jgi:hypothetical protein
MSPPLLGGDNSRFIPLVYVLISRSSVYSYLGVTPNGDIQIERPKDDKIIDELFNDLMVSSLPLPS